MDDNNAMVANTAIRWICAVVISIVIGVTIYNTITRYHVKPQMETRYTFPHDPEY